MLLPQDQLEPAEACAERRERGKTGSQTQTFRAVSFGRPCDEPTRAGMRERMKWKQQLSGESVHVHAF